MKKLNAEQGIPNAGISCPAISVYSPDFGMSITKARKHFFPVSNFRIKTPYTYSQQHCDDLHNPLVDIFARIKHKSYKNGPHDAFGVSTKSMTRLADMQIWSLQNAGLKNLTSLQTQH